MAVCIYGLQSWWLVGLDIKPLIVCCNCCNDNYSTCGANNNNNNEPFSSICRGVDVWFVLLDKPKLNSEEEESGWSGVQRCPGICFSCNRGCPPITSLKKVLERWSKVWVFLLDPIKLLSNAVHRSNILSRR